MKLTILDRLLLLGCLPPEGSLVTMRVARELRTDLGFTAKEIKDWNIREDDGNISWGDPAATTTTTPLDFTADIDVSGQKYSVIVDALKALDAKGLVRPQHLDLYDRFIPAPIDPQTPAIDN